MGKEIMSKFITKNLNSGPNGRNSVYTDSNGREFQHRMLNYRPTWDLQVHEPVAGNFYPITTAMYIKGDLNTPSSTSTHDSSSQKAQLSILVDRAQAGASLHSGEMEFMIHRRLLADDFRGVGEALNETVGGMSPYPEWQRSGEGIIVSGKQKLLLSSEKNGMKELRTQIDKMYLQPTILNQKVNNNANSDTSNIMSLGKGLGYDLPVNVHLMTLTPKIDGTLLVRLAHQFAVDEDEELSKPVTINLMELLKPYGIIEGSMQEWTLSHNQLKETQLKNKIYWSEMNNDSQEDTDFEKEGDYRTMNIVLKPMQIRTFTLKTASK